MHPNTFNACQHHWAKANGVDVPDRINPEAERAAHQHNLIGILRSRFGSKPAGA